MVIQYIRDKNNHKKGLLLAVADSRGGYLIGWSLCHPKDTFDRGSAIFHAMIHLGDANILTHRSKWIREQAEEFHTRCAKYFQVNPHERLGNTAPEKVAGL